LRELVATRTLGVFNPNGDLLAQPAQYRGRFGKRQLSMVRETPLAQWSVLLQ